MTALGRALLLLTPTLFSGLSTSAAFSGPRSPERHALGGFSPADVSDERIVAAAEFVLDILVSAVDEGSSPPYSFLEGLEEGRLDPLWEENVGIVVVEAQQQVVAGMNYDVTVAVVASETNCIGAFEATVYDHFGDLSLTQWGDEVKCESLPPVGDEESEYWDEENLDEFDDLEDTEDEFDE
uniref:Cystatin domain-containing protein n=1 Tax=Trieres chinensis TaxID=1514140 RepID=A0A7S2EAP2_TRICV|mmetsp:Transcript_14560/g.29900  ORF Transcript_14560/g.29900 Transcript_14560/m.29900 type:complete len:182 (+) Transcript_14560:108-653(+)|eukprot:CAMPEP_0183299600 /NCGR_PEP_ID=MMETSP0160_2-20130417/6287_1 /TAXON_ID=2839 ORGANISM="Odontella Sinensis, Strain Grunow 1884" /NCGR_SAMPLE_ID=MMETSP0160_2 /ASSEMBLY_ACC=CAM_ASM_000250 /LENGTH=181 /DNA_ID=CAMNT_0025461875 /DNA_START=107 /DNA_END=652 /DNA_ORIENTATION=-